MTEKNESLPVKNENEEESAHAGKVFVPHADIIETDESIVIKAEMPGVNEDAVEVTLEKNVLSIDGSAAASHFDGYNLAYAEYEAGRYQRSFTLSDRIDRDNIEASVSNGILNLTLSKIDAPQPRKIEVQAA